MWVGTERRLDLKEEASDLKRFDVTDKIRERGRERDRHEIEDFYYLELEQPTLDDHTSLVFIPPS
jgi:hypothetical protein